MSFSDLRRSSGVLLRIGLLVGLAVFLIKVTFDGTFVLYASPRYYWPVVITAIFLYAKALSYIPKLGSRESSQSMPLTASIFVALLLSGFLVAPATLSYQDALARSASTASVSASNLLSTTPTDLLGKEVTLIGFLHKLSSLGEGRFLIVRFLIRCCLADAQPVGVIVQFDGSISFKPGTWVMVRGVVNSAKVMATINNQSMEVEIPLVVASAVEATSELSDPYIYPGDQFFLLAAMFV